MGNKSRKRRKIMNKELILEMKKAYESKLSTELASALGMDTKNVVADWSLDQTVINITQVDNTATNIYTLTAKDNNILLTMLGYKTHKSANGAIIAYEATPMSIDIATFGALNSIVMNILNSDPLAIPENDEAVVEE
jgi:hypothetical protein